MSKLSAYKTDEQYLRDARLLAAAPDLLFACKKLLKAYEERSSIPDGWVAEIRAAIAKAEDR